VHDRYRALHVDLSKGWAGEGWLVHMPMPQLREMLRVVKGIIGLMDEGAVWSVAELVGWKWRVGGCS